MVGTSVGLNAGECKDGPSSGRLQPGGEGAGGRQSTPQGTYGPSASLALVTCVVHNNEWKRDVQARFAEPDVYVTRNLCSKASHAAW